MMQSNFASLPSDAPVKHNIRMINVEKVYGGQAAVKGLDLEILEGEMLVILGPSGSGKSTALNLLAGLELATGGDIYFGAERVTDVPTERREISMVFQSSTLYPHKSVRENILFALKIARVPDAIQQQRMHEITRLLGIERYLDRRVHQLSGGERQRVAIAKALVKRPKLFLLDEPFSALDALLRRDLRGEIVRIHRELGSTMLFVTHDQEEALAIADRIAVMNKGELVQLGPALEIYSRPANTWIAGFVGSHAVNLLDAEIAMAAGVAVLDTAVGRLPVSEEVLSRLRPVLRGTKVIFGIRPEFVRLSAVVPELGIVAEVYSQQNFGSSVLYHVKAKDMDLRAVVPVNQRFEIGAQVSVNPDWSQSMWFDAETKNLILAAESL
jgi:ABC-type sugar transport system ATPase subunit